MIGKKTKKFEVGLDTYDVLVDIKKRYGLKDGDDVIWWLIREVSKGQETPVKSEDIPQVQQPTPSPAPIQQPVQQQPVITPPPHYQKKQEIPYYPPVPTEQPPTKKPIHEIHDEIDKL